MKADRLNDVIAEKLTQARGVITLAQSYGAEDEMFSFALQAALDLLKDVDRHTADLADLALMAGAERRSHYANRV